MSDDTSCTTGLEELRGDAAEVRRYRLGFRHAIALSVAVMLSLALASGTLSLAYLGSENIWPETGQPATALSYHPPKRDGFGEEFLQPRAGVAQSLWALAKTYGNELLASARYNIAEARRTYAEKALNRAFAALNQSSPRQVRKFLAAYGNNEHAEQRGYIAAVKRAMAERRLYQAGEIGACGKCWCWRERPVPANDAAPTQ